MNIINSLPCTLALALGLGTAHASAIAQQEPTDTLALHTAALPASSALTETVAVPFPALSVGEASLVVPGVVEPSEQVTVSIDSDAMIREILVEAGQTVRQGDPLVRLEDRVLRAAADAAEATANRSAGVERARHAVELARLKYERTEHAHREGGANDSELDESRVSLLLAKADLAQSLEARHIAELEHKLALARMDERVLNAPFDGRVVRVTAQPGAVLRTAEPILTVAAFDTLRVSIDVSSAWFDSLTVGTTYRFAAEDPTWGQPQGTLVHVEPTINPATGTIRCEFEIENTSAARPAGFTVVPVTVDGPVFARLRPYSTLAPTADQTSNGSISAFEPD